MILAYYQSRDRYFLDGFRVKQEGIKTKILKSIPPAPAGRKTAGVARQRGTFVSAKVPKAIGADSGGLFTSL
jgi:hypothetical protein